MAWKRNALISQTWVAYLLLVVEKRMSKILTKDHQSFPTVEFINLLDKAKKFNVTLCVVVVLWAYAFVMGLFQVRINLIGVRVGVKG